MSPSIIEGAPSRSGRMALARGNFPSRNCSWNVKAISKSTFQAGPATRNQGRRAVHRPSHHTPVRRRHSGRLRRDVPVPGRAKPLGCSSNLACRFSSATSAMATNLTNPNPWRSRGIGESHIDQHRDRRRRRGDQSMGNIPAPDIRRDHILIPVNQWYLSRSISGIGQGWRCNGRSFLSTALIALGGAPFIASMTSASAASAASPVISSPSDLQHNPA